MLQALISHCNQCEVLIQQWFTVPLPFNYLVKRTFNVRQNNGYAYRMYISQNNIRTASATSPPVWVWVAPWPIVSGIGHEHGIRLGIRLTLQPTDNKQYMSDRDLVRSCDPLQNFGGSNHITRKAEPKVVKFCTRVGYINSNNSMAYHQQKGRGYGPVTVLKFCHLS